MTQTKLFILYNLYLNLFKIKLSEQNIHAPAHRSTAVLTTVSRRIGSAAKMWAFYLFQVFLIFRAISWMAMIRFCIISQFSFSAANVFMKMEN